MKARTKMSKLTGFNFTNGVLSLIIDSTAITLREDDPNYKSVRACLLTKDADGILDILSDPQDEKQDSDTRCYDFKKDNVAIVNGKIMYSRQVIESEGLVKHVSKIQDQGLPLDGMVNFINRLFNNVDEKVRDQIFGFVDRNGLTIDSDGYIIAYKAVNHNYTDKHTGKFDNSPGKVVSMDRSLVDPNPHTACGRGLHAGALGYIYTFGCGNDRIVLVRIDPADVCSIPFCSSCQKFRTCKYTVIGNYNGELKKGVYDSDKTTDEWYEEDEGTVDDGFDWDEVEAEYEEDYEEEDEWYDEDDIQVDSVEECTEESCFGTRPNGNKYYNVRDNRGRFV